MNRYLVGFILASLIIGVVSYIGSSSFILAGICLGVFLLYFLLIAYPYIKKENSRLKRYEECYHFINSYILSLNVRPSLNFAFINSKMNFSFDLTNLIEGLHDLNELETLEYLTSYFPFHIYSLFLQVIKLWLEQGGSILTASSYLLKEVERDEEYLINVKRISLSNFTETIILWSLSLLIIVILRFALNDYFLKISSQTIYLIFIAVFFLFMLVAIHLLINKTFSINIRGIKNE